MTGSADEPSVLEPTPGPAPVEADGQLLTLHLWRRLDWRLLIPVAPPGPVGYAGVVDEEMVRALRLIDAGLIDAGLIDAGLIDAGVIDAGVIDAGVIDAGVIDAGVIDIESTSGPAGPRCGTIILGQPSLAQLAAAERRLLPGGWLYAEIRRSPTLSGPRTLWGWRRILRRHGFIDVATYWHTPDLATCTRITPLDSRHTVRLTLGRHQGIRFGRVKSALGRLALSLGLVEIAIPEGSVVGRRPGPAENAAR